MVRKIIDGLAVISFLLVVGITGGGVFGYLWITNEDNMCWCFTHAFDIKNLNSRSIMIDLLQNHHFHGLLSNFINIKKLYQKQSCLIIGK